MNTRILLTLLLAVAATAAAAAPAHAGSYVVVGCSDLGGDHTVRPTSGWYLAAGVYPSRDSCAAGGSLYATGDRAPQLFRFDAPAGTTIQRLVLAFQAHLSGATPTAVPTLVVEAGHGGEWEYVAPARGYIGEAAIDFGGNRAVSDAHGADALRIGVRCELAGPCVNGGQPWARFRALAVELTDSNAPVAGLSVPAGHLHGAADVAISARDEGGGIYARDLDLDGRRLATARLCSTVPPTIGSARHVTSRVPCPLDAPAVVHVDTRTVPDGAHTFAARVEDIAHNARTATARVVVDNLPPRAGTVTLAGDPAEALTAQPVGFVGEDMSFDYRWQRCDDDGCAEIGGATSRVYSVRSHDAGHRLRAVVAATDGGGTVRVASAESALIAAPVAAPSGAVLGAAQPRARLTAWLERGRRHLRRTTVTWPGRVRIRGRLTDLRGRGLARTPVRMLERITGGRWRPITGVRTRRDGRLTTFTRIGPSRQVRFVHSGASVTLGLAVRASVRVRIRRRGRVTLVSGRVRGGRVPPAGLRVRLQSRGFGGWRTRATLRTDGLGRFSATGRAPAGARLRVVVPAQRGYPYARGVGRP
jgi:hypothetical protein